MSHDDFWSRVDIRGADDCWLWPGAMHLKYKHGDRPLTAYVWLILHGGKPVDLRVLHQPGCSKRCVNPNHLSLGTQADMVRRVHNHDHRGSKKGSKWSVVKTRCAEGHPYEVYGVVRKDGYRRCKLCHRIGQRRRAAKSTKGLSATARALLEML